ncbi:MAG: rhamnan synthesis F family protein [Ginsengibacter sp.]
MKSVCVFVHYSHAAQLPYPEEAYIKELGSYFSEIILVTNQREFNLGNLPSSVSVKMVQNEGYDFGMFYKVAQELDWGSLDRLALANDSNLLVQSLSALFNKGERLGTPFWGAIDSYERPWFSTHEENQHLQSHFLVWEKPAFFLLEQYLTQIRIQDFYDEKKIKTLRRKVINEWEIGVSQYFKKNGIMLGAAFGCEQIDVCNSNKAKPKANKTFKNPEELLQAGYPFLKKKYVEKQGFLSRILFPNNKWENLLRLYNFDSEHAERLILSIKKTK